LILTATISKPYATALNESRRARPAGRQLIYRATAPHRSQDLTLRIADIRAAGSSLGFA
jgi:hypothetical protein